MSTVEEWADEFVQVFFCARMCGASSKDAAELVTLWKKDYTEDQYRSYRRYSRDQKPKSPWKPRCDPALWVPMLPEKEWWPLRWKILRRDNYVCQYCGDAPKQMCADHVKPLSRGGSNDESNLVACCLPCNSSKSDRLLSEWKGRNGARNKLDREFA